MIGRDRIRVVIVDDHVMIRQGLITFLDANDNFEFGGEAASGEEAISLCLESQPDVVLMDLMLPGMSGAEATRKILEFSPTTQIIALTSFVSSELVEEVLRAGATSYLLKNVTAEELGDAIRAVFTGRPVLGSEAEQILRQVTEQSRESKSLQLSSPGLRHN